MPRVCFTGRATLADGTFIVRSDLEQRARNAGWIIDDKVLMGTTYLVASRTDTSKAAAARTWGTEVITYDDFWRMIASGTTVSAAQVHTLPPLDMSAMEQLEGWGMF